MVVCICLMWAGTFIHEQGFWTYCTTGKIDITLKNACLIPLRCHGIFFKYVNQNSAIVSDTCSHNHSSNIVITFRDFLVMGMNCSLFLHQLMARISVYGELGFIREHDSGPLFSDPSKYVLYTEVKFPNDEVLTEECM